MPFNVFKALKCDVYLALFFGGGSVRAASGSAVLLDVNKPL